MSIIKEDPLEGIYIHRKRCTLGFNIEPYQDYIAIETLTHCNGTIEKKSIALNLDNAIAISFELSALAHQARLDHMNKVKEWEQKQREKERNS